MTDKAREEIKDLLMRNCFSLHKIEGGKVVPNEKYIDFVTSEIRRHFTPKFDPTKLTLIGDEEIPKLAMGSAYTLENYDREIFCYNKGKAAGIRETVKTVEQHWDMSDEDWWQAFKGDKLAQLDHDRKSGEGK